MSVSISDLEGQHWAKDQDLETAQGKVDALHTRLTAAKEELADLDARRKTEFADQIERGLNSNVDDYLWRRLQLEAEVADLPFVIQRAKSAANGREAAVAGLARRLSDLRRDQES